jgi:hypothetical protein
MRFFSRIDQFSQSLALNVRGHTHHRTEFGGICTLFVFSIVCTQIVILLTKLIVGDYTAVNVFQVPTDLSSFGSITAADILLDYGYQVTDLNGVPDPTIDFSYFFPYIRSVSNSESNLVSNGTKLCSASPKSFPDLN